MKNPLTAKRVLFVFDCLELGGAERQALLLAAHMKDVLGMEVSVLGLSETEGEITRLCRIGGITSRGVPCNLRGTKSELLKTLARALVACRSFEPDLLLPFTSRPNIVSGLIWRLTGAKTCVWNQRDEGRGLDDRLSCRLAVRLSPNFISNSLAGRDILVRKYGVEEGRVNIIANGVVLPAPFKSRSEWRRDLGIVDDCLLVCMVANLHFFKDHATLIRAWRRVLDALRGNREAMLVLPGRFSGAEHELQALVSELGIEERVRFLGKLDDVSGLLRASDLYVHSSHTEGVPNAILEAMAAGLPVVATDIAGNREAVGPEGTDGLVPVRDPDAMAAKIVEFSEDRGLSDRVGRELRERAEKRFSTSEMIGATVRLLESLQS